MRVAVYARVSTSDRDPETQLMALRDYCAAQGWEIAGEYVAHASARDLAHRTSWKTTTALKRGLAASSRSRFQLDRARREGRRIGRPKVTDRRGFQRRFGAILERLSLGGISRSHAARELGIGYATLKRLLDAHLEVGPG